MSKKTCGANDYGDDSIGDVDADEDGDDGF